MQGVEGSVGSPSGHRSHLVATLKAKLGVHTMGDVGRDISSATTVSQAPVQQPLEPGEGLPALGDVMAQLDRGLDERQQLINALKANLSTSAALPKSASTCPPAARLQQKQPQMKLVQEPFQTPSQQPNKEVLGAPPTPPPMPVAGYQAASGPAHFIGTLPAASSSRPKTATAMAPPLGASTASSTPMTPVTPMTPMTPTPALPPRPGTAPASSDQLQPAAKRPRLEATDDAEVDSLQAKKAAMLRSLEAAEAGTDGAVFAEATPSSPSVASPSPDAMTSPIPSVEPPSGAPSDGGSAPPPGTSPEEYEAYRQRCWKQYFETQQQYCGLWQKYYQTYQKNTNKGKPCGGKGFGKSKGGLPGMDQQQMLEQLSGQLGGKQASAIVAVATKGGGKGPQAAMMQGKAAHTTMGARPAPRPMPQAQELEEDIHSKLLGL